MHFKATLSNSYVSLAVTWPVPKPKRKMLNRGLKDISAAVITRSPYQTDLENLLSIKPGSTKNISSLQSGGFSIDTGKTSGKEPILEQSEKTEPSLKISARKTQKQKKLHESGHDGTVSSSTSSDKESTVDNISSRIDDAEFMFCSKRFLEDRKREQRIQCLMLSIMDTCPMFWL